MIKKAVGDGHCLLNSIGPSIGKSPRQMCQLLTSYLNSDHSHKYPDFINSNDLYRGLKAYVIHKQFNSKFCDLLPQIICDCFNITLAIVTPRGVICLTPRLPINSRVPLVGVATVAVFYKKYHYDSIIPRQKQGIGCPSPAAKPTELATAHKIASVFDEKSSQEPRSSLNTSTVPTLPAATDLVPCSSHGLIIKTSESPQEPTIRQLDPTATMCSPATQNPPKTETLRAVALNVSGFLNKVERGVLDIYLKEFDIICLSETHTDDVPETFSHSVLGEYNHLTQKLNPANLTTADQKFGGIHGLMILTNPRLSLSRIADTVCDSVLWATVSNGHDSVTVGAAYLPIQSKKYPDEVRDKIWGDLNSDLTLLNAKGCDQIMIMGDMNAHTGLLDDQPKSMGDADVSGYMLGLDLIEGISS